MEKILFYNKLCKKKLMLDKCVYNFKFNVDFLYFLIYDKERKWMYYIWELIYCCFYFLFFLNKVEGFDKMIENDSLKRGIITRRNDDKV